MSNIENLEGQSQKKAKLTIQDIEENSIDQLLAQPIPELKETLEKLLAANNEEIARLAKLNKKILECLDRIDQKNQENVPEFPKIANESKEDPPKIGLLDWLKDKVLSKVTRVSLLLHPANLFSP
jgi:hypothetical protein